MANYKGSFPMFAVKTKVYDVVEKKLIGVFDSQMEAAAFAGIPRTSVTSCVKNKSKCRKNALNKILAFR